MAAPRFLAAGGRDLLMLDDKNVLWRWRPANDEGKGTVTRVRVNGADALGRRHRRPSGPISSDPERGPLQPVRRRPVRGADPRLLAGARRERIPGPLERLACHGPGRRQDDLPVHRRRHLHRPRTASIDALRVGQERRLGARQPGDTLLREAARRRSHWPAGATARGHCLRLRPAQRRIIALDKADGDFIAQYRLAGDADGWEDLRGMYVARRTPRRPADRGLDLARAASTRRPRARAGRGRVARAVQLGARPDAVRRTHDEP